MNIDIGKLIIDGEEITPIKDACEISFSNFKPKCQSLLLDVKPYPCLIICLCDNKLYCCAEIKRGSESYEKYKNIGKINVLNDVENIEFMRRGINAQIQSNSPGI